jgi:peptide/nickel transport system substrate-binding protein
MIRGLKRTILAGAAALALGTGPALAEDTTPKYGGTLEVGTVYVSISALSWDPHDWNWKLNHDTGLFYEQLFAADLSKAKRNGGKFSFVPDAWLSSEALRGELAESWAWKENPPRVEIKLRKGIMFPEKPGVMKAREFVADDVVFSFNRLNGSPRRIKDYFAHVEKVEATDKHTVVFTFKDFFAEWDYRFG